MSNATGTGVTEKNLGWRVTFAGLGINLALGVLYSWSILRGGMVKAEWGWTAFQMSLPYSIACLVFCVVMVPAGLMQDKLSPRLTATIGGILVGIGMITASLMGNSLAGWIIGFGILAGAGIGFGYASATPPAVKWFPAAKTGLIAGLVVSGFGLASVYIAPLGDWLIGATNLTTTAMVFGIGFLVVVVGLAQFLTPPPKGYVPAGTPAAPAANGGPVKKENFTPTEMLRTWQFWVLWFMYACGAGAGLMVISVAKTLAKTPGMSAGKLGVIAVTTLAIGNGAGRIIAGMLSDKIGRKATMVLFFLFQALMVILLAMASPDNALGGVVVLPIIAALVGANYGANLSLFPSVTKDFYGMKNFGVNYGLIFTAWGVGGFMLSQVAGYVKDRYDTFTYSFIASAVLLVAAAAVTLVIKAPHHTEEITPATAPEGAPAE